jgi:acetate CoA/acetoacetate CoA-transferase beta subunit
MKDTKGFIAARVAKELKDGNVVSLGIGLPTQVENYIPESVRITLLSENGIVGEGLMPSADDASSYVVDAGGEPASVLIGGSFVDSAVSFGIIRGGHVDVTVIGALEVDEEGNLVELDHTGQKGSRHGRSNGFGRWSQEGHYCHGAHQ